MFHIRRRGIGLTVSVAFLVVSCATGYHEQRLTGGYTVFPMGDDRYQIKVEYNLWTSQKKRSGIGLLRAAELARTKGYEGFRVESKSTLFSSSVVMTQTGTNTAVGGSVATPYGYVMTVELSNESEAIPAEETIAQYAPLFGRYNGNGNSF